MSQLTSMRNTTPLIYVKKIETFNLHMYTHITNKYAQIAKHKKSLTISQNVLLSYSLCQSTARYGYKTRIAVCFESKKDFIVTHHARSILTATNVAEEPQIVALHIRPDRCAASVLVLVDDRDLARRH